MIEVIKDALTNKQAFNYNKTTQWLFVLDRMRTSTRYSSDCCYYIKHKMNGSCNLEKFTVKTLSSLNL